MSGDAIVVFHPKVPERLEPFLDLDDESEESEGLYAEELEDGTMLVHTFQPFALFVDNPDEAIEWLAQFGDALPDVHDDPRGLLFFPDTIEPAASTYEELVAEIGEHGVFFATDDDEAIDLEALASQLFAGQSLGAAPGGSFEMGKMLQDMQRQLAGALGIDPDGGKSPVHDEEFEPDEPPKKP